MAPMARRGLDSRSPMTPRITALVNSRLANAEVSRKRFTPRLPDPLIARRTCQRLRRRLWMLPAEARPHPARGLAAGLTRIRLGEAHQEQGVCARIELRFNGERHLVPCLCLRVGVAGVQIRAA